jgi:pimeloyl-ACP methyl ester carboxylesterase
LGDDEVATRAKAAKAPQGDFSTVGYGSITAAAGTPASPIEPVTAAVGTAVSPISAASDAASATSAAKPTTPSADAVDETEVDPWTQIFYDYIFHANARLPATGEAAMKMSNIGTGFARLPLHNTLPGALADTNIHVTAIYGRQTWMAPGCGRDLLEELRTQRIAARKRSLEEKQTDEAATGAAQPHVVLDERGAEEEEEGAANGVVPAAEAVRPKWAPKRVPMTGAQLNGKAPAVLFPVRDGRVPAAMFTQQDDGCIYDFAFVPRAGHQLNTDNPADFNALMHRALRID